MKKLRRLVEEDVSSCFELLRNLSENYLSENQLQGYGISHKNLYEAIVSQSVVGHVCSVGDQIAGFVFCDASSGQILALYVLPKYEKRGIGRSLIEEMIETLKTRGFSHSFLASNPDKKTRSYGFYRWLGWKETGRYSSFGDEILAKVL